MSNIPSKAIKLGASSLTQEPISYGKSRVAGSKSLSYFMHSRSGSMPGQPDIFSLNSLSKADWNEPLESNTVMKAFRRNNLLNEHSPIGPRQLEIFKHEFTFEKYCPHDDEALEFALQSAYRQICGNMIPMESERIIDSERRLRNGDLSIRNFVREIAKSNFYKEHYFNSVNQQRSIELNFKHILGRPPISQAEIVDQIIILFNFGFETHIDALIDSVEYDEIFGEYTVPYMRCWESPCGMPTSTFNNSCALTVGFVNSDNSLNKRKNFSENSPSSSILLTNLAKGISNEINLRDY